MSVKIKHSATPERSTYKNPQTSTSEKKYPSRLNEEGEIEYWKSKAMDVEY